MNIDRVVMFFAGCVVLLSLVLSVFSSDWWLLLALFAGVNMVQASITGFCPLAKILKMVGVKAGAAFETPAI
jgi:hypothetical protein